MSVPYGAPQQQPPAGPPAQQPAAGLDLAMILPLVAAGLGLISYFLAFADDVSVGGVTYLLAAGILAGLTALPKAPRAGLLYPAVVLAGVQALGVLQGIIKSDSVQGMEIVLLIVALLETAAVVMTLLLDAGIVKFEPKPANPYAGQQGQPGGWNPQSGAFPQQGQPQFGQQQPQQQAPQQFGQQPQQPQQPQQGQQPPQQTSFMPQPGQFGNPGTPPGGFGGPQS